MLGFLTTSVSGVMTDVGTVVSQGLSWMGDAANAVASNGLLMIGVCVPLIGVGIGLLKRAIS